MFGISCAPELYQHIIRQVLSECKGALNIADDVIVHGKDNAEHDDNLEKVLQRLREKGLTACLEKCLFRQPSVKFYGLQLSRDGVQPTKDKIKAVLDAPAPTSASEVRSFLGLVGFSARFLPHLSTTAEPLRKVTHKGATFTWQAEQQEAFDELKQQLAQATALAYFDKDAPTEVIADASPVGLGAVLIQKQDGEKRVVCYASRTLTNVEKRYSQTEKEALSLVWACERFNQYLFGIEFTLLTDHKPLEVIYGPRSRPSARIERWVLRMQPYKFNVKHIAGKDNIADVLSRLPTRASPEEESSSDSCNAYVRWVASAAAPVAITIQEIERASAQDTELSQIHSAIQSGNLDDIPAPFKMVRNELTNIGFVILRGPRIVPPQSLCDDIISLAHEGHQGIVKTKERLRSKVWWPGVDAEAERKCKSCHSCQVVSQTAPTQPLVKPTPLPQGPWEHLAADLLGPLPSGESLLVTVDYYSRYFEVDILRSTTSKVVTSCLLTHFARHGVPVSIRTDNGPQFVSEEFTDFLKEMGVQHRRNTPLWPRANGEVERQNRTLLKSIRIAHLESRPWRVELNNFLLAYRSAPHSTTGASPAHLLFGREIRTKIPSISFPTPVSDYAVRDRDSSAKQRTSDYANAQCHARPSAISAGDMVLVQNSNLVNKLSPPYSVMPHSVVARHGDQLILQSPDHVIRRNVAHAKPCVPPPPPPSEKEEEESAEESVEESAKPQETTAASETRDEQDPPPHCDRPRRTIKVPERFNDFITSFQ